MTHPTTIRTAFASAEDAAKIYGISSKQVKQLRKLLSQFNTHASRKRSAAFAKQSGRARKASRSKVSTTGRTASRRTTRRAA